MTDNQQGQQQIPQRDWGSQDWGEADNLLSQVAAGGLLDHVEVPVTLVVHGQIIVGTIISGKRWFKENVEAAGQDPETHPGGLASFYRTFRDRQAELERVLELEDEQELTETDEKALGDFAHVLHLKDAQVRLPVAVNVTYPQNVYMRVRLASVDAWHFGSTTWSVGGAADPA